MIAFEKYLLSKGFKKYRFNCKTMSLQEANDHHISTLENLDHRYIKDDKYIIVGLCERGKPVTLEYPRPHIRVVRNGEELDERHDDAMNIILREKSFDEIYEAMFNKDITLESIN